MGNCMETCEPRGSKKEEEVGGDGVSLTPSQKESNGGIRVKMLLTREELEWLVLQLGQQKRLEDLMAEMAKRGTSTTDPEDAADRGLWKPSLESIMEAPEAHSF